MTKKQQKLKATEGGRQTSGVQKDKGKQKAATSAVQKDKGKQKAPSRSSSRLKASENPKTPTTATTSKKRKEKPTTPDSDSDFDIPLHFFVPDVECSSEEKVGRSTRTYREEKGSSPVSHSNVKLANLKKSIEECQDGHAFSRMFILHSLGTLLVPGNSWKISLNYAKYLNEDFSLIGQLNWGKYVVDTLLLGLDEFQSKLSYPSGDFNFLAVSCKEYRYGTVADTSMIMFLLFAYIFGV
ncbi:hypothetical protein LINPERPRIM_LOCUS18142 [Linum perenne]